ncbi:MAG TPA: DNA topoisomerase (ATP-hydrolyzing), partial [Acidimicrobiia bacterium]
MATRTPPSENVPEIEITQEMEQSFVDYAMSVIVSRALPDVRDGLKPVQRRIIYSMFENNITAASAHRKCSKVVGDVMGNYHPHGDTAIYDALVRMGQDFSMRHLLIDPQGNFGSIDDPPGAARYTECRLTKLSNHLLDGIREDTVNFEDNYSGEMQQPSVLPARFPNLLVNGSQGIAVGMATNIPPHNLNEVIDACIHVIDNPDANAEELMQFVKGPDFPTGGFLVGTAGIRDALTTGRGSVKLRGVCDVQEIRKGRTAIIATELPYQVSMERIMAKIKELVDSRRIEGIAEVRNETSDRVGTRLVVELKANAVPQVVLNQLYKNTPLQDSFSYNMVSLVDGVPRTLNLSEMIGYYLDHQMEVVERRTRFRLEEAQARAHILEGLIIAVDNIDEVIQLIRGSADTGEARSNLIERFELSEIQANAILDMPLRRLTALEVD